MNRYPPPPPPSRTPPPPPTTPPLPPIPPLSSDGFPEGEPAGAGPSAGFSLFHSTIGTRALMNLLRRVGTSLHAGVDARRIWDQEAHRGTPGYRGQIEAVSRRIAEGDTLYDAMNATGEFFPPLVREMVRVGETTGRLDEVLVRLADHYEHSLELRRSFLIGIAWPAIQFTVAVLIIGFLIWIFGWISARGDTTIDPLGFGLVGNQGVLIYFGGILGIFAVMFFFYVGMQQGWFGSGPSRLLVRIPLLGHCLQMAALARLSWTLSLALESGLDARRSLRLALRSSQLPFYQDIEGQADEVIVRGGEFHEALRIGRRLPSEFLDSLESGEHAGRAAESLEVLSRDYAERSKLANRMLTTFATFATWAFVAMTIIFLIFRVAMFYLGMLDSALKMLD